jgi:hypothetical protein
MATTRTNTYQVILRAVTILSVSSEGIYQVPGVGTICRDALVTRVPPQMERTLWSRWTICLVEPSRACNNYIF